MDAFIAWIRANTGRRFRRAAVAAVGGSMALAGLALLVLPGPGIPLLLAGLGVLGLEFAIARTWIEAVRRRAEGAGVPRRVMWMLPAAGIAVSLAFAAAPAFLAIVHSPEGWTVVAKPHASFRHAYASVDELAAPGAGPDAAEILRRSGLGSAAGRVPPG
jgi:hypothetical protein